MNRTLFNVFISLLITTETFAACSTGYFPGSENEVTRKYIYCDSASELPSSGMVSGDILSALDTGKVYVATSETTYGTTASKPSNDDQIRISDSSSDSTWKQLTDCDGLSNALTYDTATNSIGCNSITAGGVSWGSITGTLSNQSDIQTALNGKASSLGTDDNYVTDAQLTVITNTSGTNTGDQSEASIEGVVDLQDLQGAVTDSQVPNNITITESDPKVGTLTNTKWCTTNGTSINCTSDTPGGSSPLTTKGDLFAFSSINDRFPIGTNGQILSADSSQTFGFKWADQRIPYTFVSRLTSDQVTTATTTPVTLAKMTFSYETNSVYRIWIFGRVRPTAATTGCSFQFDLSSAVTTIDLITLMPLATSGTNLISYSSADNTSHFTTTGHPSIAEWAVVGNGMLVTTSNTGTATLMFRSETTAVTMVKAGLMLVVEKIA